MNAKIHISPHIPLRCSPFLCLSAITVANRRYLFPALSTHPTFVLSNKQQKPMSLIYTLVKRKDMSTGASPDAKLYYGQTSVTKQLKINQICTRIERLCTASRGDILLVLDGLMKVMNDALTEGESVHLGEFGSFRMVAGSRGCINAEDFDTSLFKRPRIVFYPGTMLIGSTKNITFERFTPKKDAALEEEEETV